MSENNSGRLLGQRTRRNVNPNLHVGNMQTTLTQKELRNALSDQTGQIAAMLGVLDARLEQMGIFNLQQGTGQNRAFMRNMRENLSSIRQQTRATTSLSDMPFRDIPKAIQERIISGFKRTIIDGVRSPFTLAAYVGYHGIIMPIPIVIRHAGGLFYLLHAYFFTFVIIFGTRYYYVEYADDEYAQYFLNFVYNTFYYVLYPTKTLINLLINFTRLAFTQSKRNFDEILPTITDGVKGATDMAISAYCDNAPFWARFFVGCK